ncbi:uncharacterized protein LOC130749707 isoform X1 [Lotus japonicus]|uniref:uncharacterized protein LOC130749707 isoform X1 n=1 Tax=Lotus japonicus TaxID=34305 RepID=UPI00258E5E2A|nr:uncharacterized protein LOC130749707 isoform X1 [Lotus japonicus]
MNLQSLTPFLPRSRQASSQIGIFLFNSSIREPETVFAENSCVISLQQTLVDLLDLVGRRILVGPVLPFISSFALRNSGKSQRSGTRLIMLEQGMRMMMMRQFMCFSANDHVSLHWYLHILLWL